MFPSFRSHTEVQVLHNKKRQRTAFCPTRHAALISHAFLNCNFCVRVFVHIAGGGVGQCVLGLRERVQRVRDVYRRGHGSLGTPRTARGRRDGQRHRKRTDRERGPQQVRKPNRSLATVASRKVSPNTQHVSNHEADHIGFRSGQPRTGI